ncbi:hypothetical protein [Hymenobacter qilianensis]|uniref:Replication protein n=1 Tax=Hymenobacter qilianensis TaxID=1385715 RepID=A0A7H0H1W6_9BACT|nr:hypothetical protein [Hymenobacter qilianensis]QNP54532.1 hypothetical protein H9L05_22745 [Hymenobacter qilianensis]
MSWFPPTLEPTPSSYTGVGPDKYALFDVELIELSPEEPVGPAFREEPQLTRAEKRDLTEHRIAQLSQLPGARGTLYRTWQCDQGLPYRKRYPTSCGLRWCFQCACNRMGTLVRKYLPLMETWENPQLLTLTVPSCVRAELPDRVKHMLLTFTKISELWNKHYHRNRRYYQRYGHFHPAWPTVPLVGLREVEISYTLELLEERYHPHIHFILRDATTAQALLARWLQVMPGVNAWGQNLKAVYCLQGALCYVLKPAVNFGARNPVPAAAMDTIFQVLALLTPFYAYGMRAPKKRITFS